MNRINELFDNLDDWRHFPSYQLERRADIFFSIYMKTLVQSKFDLEIEHVIPEFPVRIGTIYPKIDTNRSFKIDYFAKARGSNKVIFVELKTDAGSRSEKQDWYLERAEEVGVVKLLEGVAEIYRKTNAKKKYRCLLTKLESMCFVKSLSDGNFEIVQAEYKTALMYIQPNNEDGEENVLTFHEVTEIIGQHNDELSQRFAQSLRYWASVKAGDCLN